MTTQVPQQMIAGGPAFSAYQSSGQTLSANTWTKIQMQTKIFDTASAFDNTNNYRFQPLVAGYYQINGGLGFGSGVSNTLCTVGIYKNGINLINGPQLNVSGTIYILNASGLVYLNGSTDYVEFYAFSSTSFTTVSANTATIFNGCLLRAA